MITSEGRGQLLSLIPDCNFLCKINSNSNSFYVLRFYNQSLIYGDITNNKIINSKILNYNVRKGFMIINEGFPKLGTSWAFHVETQFTAETISQNTHEQLQLTQSELAWRVATKLWRILILKTFSEWWVSQRMTRYKPWLLPRNRFH